MKKFITLSLAIAILLCAIPVGAVTFTEEQYSTKITALRKEYPHGKYWNLYNGVDSNGVAKAGSVVCSGYSTSDGVSCTTHGYCAYEGYCTCECGYYDGAWQCNGFARLMGAKVFGVAPSNSSWTKIYNSTTVYAGDILRFGTDEDSGHSVFVTKVVGNTVYFCDCNATGPCRIRWDGSISNIGSTKLYGYSFLYIYHYKGNTLTGNGHTHSYTSSVTTAATCTADGVKTFKCSCGASDTEKIPATGHSWGVGVITTVPTCLAEGVRTYTCATCKNTKTESVPKAHDFVHCGQGLFKCSACNETALIEKLSGSEWTDWTEMRPGENDTVDSYERKIQYSSRTSEVKYSAWGAWSSWISDNIYKNSPTREVASATGYKWGCYECPNCKTHDPLKGACTNCGTTITDSGWRAMWSDVPWSSGTKVYSSIDKTRYNFGGSIGYMWSAKDHAVTTIYRYRDRTATTEWSKWSNWQDTSITLSSEKEVIARTVYRYKLTAQPVEAPTVTSISISSLPSKTSYIKGQENLNLAGAKIHVNYSDSFSTTIDVTSDMVSGFDNTKIGTNTITVSYEGKTTTFDVTIIAAKIDEDAPQLIVSTAKSRRGQEVTLDVSVKNNPGICAFTLGIEYDETRLALKNVTFGENLIGITNFTKKAVWSGAADVAGDITLLTITFTIKDDAAEGDAPVGIIYTTGDISNYAEEDIDFVSVSGKVEVVNYMPGDITGDFAVNSHDLTRLVKYFSGDTDEFVEEALDVNGDGAVNSKDLTHLVKFLSGEEVTLY